jgi:hypothetical protein
MSTSTREGADSVSASARPGRAISLIPKDWSTAAVFSPVKQVEVREIVVNGNTWRMGIHNPLNKAPSSAIDMAHVRILLAVLSFWQGQNPLSMSLKELGRRAAGSHGGAFFRLLRQRLGDLRDYWISVELENGDKRMFPAISRIEVTSRKINATQQRLALDDWPAQRVKQQDDDVRWVQLDNVVLAPEFAEFLSDFTNLMNVRLDVLRTLSSDVAQAMYLFIPSRAVYRAKTDPWKINLANLFEQLGMTVPSSKSLRRKTMEQHGTRSVIRQLDTVPILNGNLRVGLALNKQKTDWMLLAWVEEVDDLPDLSDSKSALVKAWRESGRREEELAKLLRSPLPELTDEESVLCEAANVELLKIQRFLRLCKVAIGTNRLHRVLAELKIDVIERRGVNKPTGALVWRLLTLVAEPVAASSRVTTGEFSSCGKKSNVCQR